MNINRREFLKSATQAAGLLSAAPLLPGGDVILYSSESGEKPESYYVKQEAQRRQAGRQHLLGFMHYVWWNTWGLIIGRHTRAISDRITKAVDDFEAGRSTFLVIEVPIRHGKSDMVSIALPPYFLGRCAYMQPDVITSGYGAEHVEDFSRKARTVVESEDYRNLFPGVRLSSKKNAANKWAIQDSVGEVTAASLEGSLTGRGGHLLILDDYCKSRMEAESPTTRKHTWEAFKDNFMTRRAPVSIVIVCASRWHVDDVIGNIKKEMEGDEDFPRFEFMKFPARKEDEYEYLFPERFPEDWYKSQRATLGKYSSAALLDLDPTIRGGNMFKIDNIVWVDKDDVPSMLQARFWDLASTQKELDKDDPDFTAGARGGVTFEDGLPVLWLTDLKAMQKEAPERNRLIYGAAMSDGAEVEVLVESVAGYKDAYTSLRNALTGLRMVTKVNVTGDKVSRAAPLEALFDAGNVRVVRAAWNDIFVHQMGAFPSTGVHDDIPDAVSGVYTHLRKRQEPFGLSADDLDITYPD